MNKVQQSFGLIKPFQTVFNILSFAKLPLIFHFVNKIYSTAFYSWIPKKHDLLQAKYSSQLKLSNWIKKFSYKKFYKESECK